MLSCLRLYEIEVKVFSDFPEALAFIKVFIIKSSYFDGCWGRCLVSESLCIMVQIHLEWLGYQPGVLVVLGSNPSDPTTIIQTS